MWIGLWFFLIAHNTAQLTVSSDLAIWHNSEARIVLPNHSANSDYAKYDYDAETKRITKAWDATADAMQRLVDCVTDIARLDDPRVSAILTKYDVQIFDKDGKQLFPPEEK